MTMLKARRFIIQRENAPGAEGLPPEETAAQETGPPQEPGSPSAGTPAPQASRPAGEPASTTGTAAGGASAGADLPESALLFDNQDDGFGSQPFATARAAAPGSENPPSSPALSAKEAAIEAIRAEGLTGRQLRNARRIAQRHNFEAQSDYDAVRLLRAAGIDPFQRGAMLDLNDPVPVPPAAANSPAGGPPPPPPPPRADDEGSAPPREPVTGRALTPLPGDNVTLPQTIKPAQLPSTEVRAEINHAAEIRRMQSEIARRRRRRLMLLFTRLFVLVLLPTLIAGWYFSTVATRQYGTKSEFSVQMAESPMAAGGMGGLLQGTSMATSQDSIAVQGYLQSREAMLRLENDLGFRAFFQGAEIDPILRLPPDASLEQAYRVYQSHILISYDPSEGIIRMEVIAPDPELAVSWSRQLIAYAEEQVDQLTQRLREDSMSGARDSYDDAEAAVVAAHERVIALQERHKVLSSEAELTLLTQQIAALDSQLIQEKLSLAQMEANTTPNLARMEPVKRRIATLETEISSLRKRLTEGEEGGTSLAQIQGQLMVAQADVQTRQMILAQALQAMENSRIEANRQTRYLSTSVTPIAPDEATYPRVFENTLVTMLILLGIYLMFSMTIAILREQVSA